MDLATWLKLNIDAFSHQAPGGAFCVGTDSGPNWTQLWSLSDYSVSSVSGDHVWLVRK